VIWRSAHGCDRSLDRAAGRSAGEGFCARPETSVTTAEVGPGVVVPKVKQFDE
jgi:hypothetical protein